MNKKGENTVDKNLNVCLLNDSFPPLIDGVANAVVNYADIINKSYGRALVAVPAYPDTDDSQFPFDVVRYPSINTTPLVGYRAGMPYSYPQLHEIEQFKPDIIHTHCPIASTLMARAVREITEAPVIFTYHTKFDIDIANAIQSNLVQQIAIDALVRNIEACDDVWVVSRGAGENLRSLGYTGDYIVMENGVDVPKGRAEQEKLDELSREYGLEAGVPLYLFVGRMMWYKGARLTLDALRRLSDNNMPFRMAFIGDGADRREIMDYAQEQGIADRCIFTGAIHDRELLKVWYSRADLFIFPSMFDTNGIVVREAAACGLGSMLIEGSCAAEGVTDGCNGILVQEDSDSIAESLMKFSGNSDKLHEIGQNAMDELYISWEESVAHARERYLEVLDRFEGRSEVKRHPAETAYKLIGDVHSGIEKLHEHSAEQLDKINEQIARLRRMSIQIKKK